MWIVIKIQMLFSGVVKKSSNGLADLVVNINTIAEVKFVRLINPAYIFTDKFYDKVDYKVKGNKIEF